MKIAEIRERQKRAVSLKKDMDRNHVAHQKHIDDFSKKLCSLSPAQRKRANEAFIKMEKKYDEKDDVAYEKYYNHMHKDFDMNKSKIDFTAKKYKQGFCDEKYINDMYADKIKQVKSQKTKSVRTKSPRGKFNGKKTTKR